MVRALSAKPYVPIVYWEQVVECASLERAIKLISRAYNFKRHPYFIWAQHPATTRTSFRCSQARFRYAVEGWSQALAAVVARIPRMEIRRAIVENMADEAGAAEERSHKASFQRFLVALGTTRDELETPCPIQVRAFQQALTNYCLVHEYDAGAAALGIIEHLYTGISAAIAQLIAEREWAAPQDHYDVHAELDVEHARELLRLAEPSWPIERLRREAALALLLGAHHFWTLYNDLLPTD
jgi:pyrroloquinoline-quinone synthase